MSGRMDDWEYKWPPSLSYASEDGASDSGVLVSEAHDPKALKSLLSFCVNNRDLNQLENMIGSFNPLKIIGVADSELCHSNVLSWLLDPRGHHGLGDSLFKNILLEVLKHNNGSELPQIKDIISADFGDLRILREWRNIDLLAVSHSHKLAVVIENKINAGESDGQLKKYSIIVGEKYKQYKRVFMFLTLDGTKPRGSELYIPFTHAQIHSIVQSAVELRRDYMNAKVYDFIGQYLEILEAKTMQNNEFIEICTRLYREHGAAIKMIINYGKPRLSPEYIREFHNQTDTVSVHAEKDSVNVYYTFIPQAWDGIVPTTNKYTQDKYLVFFTWNFSDYENHKIALSLNIGNFQDPEERGVFVDRVYKAAGKNSILTIRRSSKTNTTVFSKTLSLKNTDSECDLDDYETVTAKLVEVYNSDEVQNALRIIDGVVRDFKFKDNFQEVRYV